MGRTRLTTAPGEPLVEDHVADRGEQWSSALSVPVEPSWPGRFRRLWITALVVILVVVLVGVFVRLNERGNSFDPALDPERFGPSETTTDTDA